MRRLRSGRCSSEGELLPARLAVRLEAEVLVERPQAVVMRGRPGRRRVLVIADDRVSPAKVAAELRELAEHLAPVEVL